MPEQLTSLRPPGFVYFVHAPGCDLIKIGYSSQHPDARFSSLQVNSPIPLERLGYIRGHVALERELQSRFRGDRSHGEWYMAAPGLAAFVRGHAEPWAKAEPKPKSSLVGIRWGKAVPIRKLAAR